MIRRLLLPALLSLLLLAPPLAVAERPAAGDASTTASGVTTTSSDTFGLPVSSPLGSTLAVVLLAALGLLLVDQRESRRKRR